MVRILIVDDEAPFRRALRLALRVQGYDIQEASSGPDALEILQHDTPDLILVDWLMPGMDGLGLCRAIRQGSDVPIILITSRTYGQPEALAAGANDYLRKPFSVDDLLHHIHSTLDR